MASCITGVLVRIAQKTCVRSTGVLCGRGEGGTLQNASGCTSSLCSWKGVADSSVAHAATACEGTDNEEQCTDQERKGSGHCWKEEVSGKPSSQHPLQNVLEMASKQ